MSYSLNQCQILGNCVKDPEKRVFQDGGFVVNMSVATSERWKDVKTGEMKESTTYHRVSIFNEKLGALAMEHLRKGSRCYISGQIKNRKFQDKDGKDKFSTEINLGRYNGELILLDGRSQAPEHIENAPERESEDEINFL